jgi:hypothetical protein
MTPFGCKPRSSCIAARLASETALTGGAEKWQEGYGQRRNGSADIHGASGPSEENKGSHIYDLPHAALSLCYAGRRGTPVHLGRVR